MKEISIKHLTFIIIFSISITAVLLAGFFGNITQAFLTFFSIVIILYITKSIWFPENYGNTRIRMYSLSIILFLSAPTPLWLWVIENITQKAGFSPQITFLDKIIYAFVAIIVIWIVNYYMSDRTGMIKHFTDINKDYPEEPTFKERFLYFANVLKRQIENIDNETNWSAHYFTPLDAEVEIKKGNNRSKKLSDLLTALKKNRNSKVFLILGDPGAGKSVALRKLCLELLEEVKIVWKLPIYINLKEWYIENKWTKQNPPTSEQLHNFILSQLKGKDVDSDKFLEKYYYRLLENGRLFLVLDSFDEIPLVLDEDENSWLIDKLSEVIYNTLAGANQSRGILSSRFFRKPTIKFNAETELQIRPFTAFKIEQNLKKFANIDKNLISELFENHPELIPIIRNPFVNTLLNNYIDDNDGKLPQNQSELYANYINNRLKSCQNLINNSNLKVEDIIDFAKNIALLMFKSEKYGLEIPIDDIKSYFPENKNIKKIIEILIYAKISRVGRGLKEKFSFVHRRFNEYFVAINLLDKKEKIDFKHIPTDSRWRDALVLYTEITTEEEAREIANNCWNEIKTLENNKKVSTKQYLKAIHSLRFLADAFRGRKQCLNDFIIDLTNLINDKLNNSESILERKLITEAIGLLNYSDIDLIVIKALKIGNNWISENAINSCRHLPNLSPDLTRSVLLFLYTYSDYTFFIKRKEIIFQFSLSNSFIKIFKACKLREIEISIFLLGIILLFVINPVITFVSIVFYYYFKFESYRLITQLDEFPNQMIERSFFIFTSLILVFSNIPYVKNSKVNKPISEYFLDYKLVSPFYPYLNYLYVSFNNLSLMLVSFVQKTTLFSSNILLTLALILILPFPISRVYYLNWKKTSFFLLSIIFILAIIPIIITFLIKFLFGKLIFILILLISILIYFYSFSRIFYYILLFIINYYYYDLKNLKKIKDLNNSSKLLKKIIEQNFNSFKTAKGRLKYVKFLEQSSFTVEGNWIHHTTPNKRNDEASTLLAKLDEKWIGLDR
jgi:hypothetical protein